MNGARRPAEGQDHRPLHRQVADRLAAAIAAGEYPPGSRLPAENELASDLAVSRGTLRQALAGLREAGLIESIPARGSFVRQATPRRPDARRRVIGVVVPSVAKPYVPDLLAGIEDELHRHSYAMLVGSSGSTRQQQAGRVHRILDEGAAGLIAYPIDYDPDPDLFRALAGRDFPVLLIDRHLVGLDLDSVLPDNLGGAFAAVSHLAEQGHRRIGFVSTDNTATTSVAERAQGYRQALAAAGLDFDPDLLFDRLPVARSWPDLRDAKVDRTAERIAGYLARARPSAVFALHDRLAVEVLQAAHQLGWRVPEDLAVAGFDDDPLAAALSVPLTTVAQPRERIGRVAAGLIVDRIEGRRSEAARIVLATRLVVRRSTAVPLAQPASA